MLNILFIPTLVHAELGYVEPWGKDSDLHYEAPKPFVPPKKLSLMGKFAEQAILFHHNVLTQIDGPRSHFKPSSSNYMLQAIRKYGFVKGYIMGCDRLLRENDDPWVYKTEIHDEMIFKSDPPN